MNTAKTTEQTLKKLLLQRQESEVAHSKPEKEYQLYRLVQQGDWAGVCALEKHAVIREEEIGVLSPDPLRNEKYHFVVLAAMLTRFCVEGGLDCELAYTMSDYYIQQMDKAATLPAVKALHDEMLKTYTLKMRELANQPPPVKPLRLACEYIHLHICAPMRAGEIAAAAHVSPDHLGRLFRQQYGMNLFGYIQSEKCKTACYLLECSPAGCTEIAGFLGYASASRFAAEFKKHVGCVPSVYRQTHYRRVTG